MKPFATLSPPTTHSRRPTCRITTGGICWREAGFGISTVWFVSFQNRKSRHRLNDPGDADP
jgi:hypothetical protein